jgi:non-specific serine/threonine protein kinase
VHRGEAVRHLRAAAERELTPLRRRVEPLDNLPLQLTRFVGRDAELAQLRQLIESERLLTLTGSGGIGKTRLALELAGTSRDAFADGVWLIDLAPLAEPELVAQAVAEPLGVRAEAEVAVQQALLDYLRTRELLLVFDNCEHLIDACATLADAILRSCPSIQIVATSREPLHIAGETAWRVPSLSLPDASAAADNRARLLECEAVRLFADRALASAGLVVSEANAAAVARVCERLDGIPLAIELAAARSGVLSVEQIAHRLDNRFRLLVGRGRTAPARQQTLRAAIDWSYELLPAAERRLLNCLSVFAGGWTLEAAERVGASERTPSEDVFELLAHLVDKSLVQAEPGAAGQLRYRLLESLRAYAHERLLEHGDAPSAQRRHCRYFADLAERAELRLLWGAGGLDWLARLDRELPNLRAALAWSISGEGEPIWGLALAHRLGHYWYTRGDRAEGRSWLKRALALVPAPAADGDPTAASAWAWAVLWAGGLAHGQTDYEEASRLVARALEMFERLDDRRGIGWAYSFLGNVARARAELPRAVAYFEQAIAAFRSTPEEVNAILPLAALGFTVCLLGDQPRASQLLQESVGLARQSGSVGRLAIASIYLGQVAFLQGDLERASAALQEGLRLFREWDSAWGMAECLEGLAVVAGAQARFERAARLLGAAARLREAIGAPVHPVDRADHERTVAASEAALGAQAYAAAWQAGQTMLIEDVIELAVTGSGPPPEAAPTPPSKAQLLTGREREVAVLIARGLSNRQIAETLVIAERTVTNHVEHIFDKLDFRSRAQVATWVTEQQLDRPDVSQP